VIEQRSELITELLGSSGRLIVASNRGPITFETDHAAPGGLIAERGSGGLVTALAELGRHAPVTWVAAAMTEGDRIAAPLLRSNARSNGRGDGSVRGRGRIVRDLIEDMLPGQDLELAYVPLDEDVFDRYYRVISNPFLWFLQHRMYSLAYGPNIDAALIDAWRNGYRAANLQLAEGIAQAAAGLLRPVVLLQDYHLYLTAPRVRDLLPEATILHFNHIPWPAESEWQILPQRLRREICEGLLACDIVGLQTSRYATNFLETVASFVRDARVDREGRSVRWRDRRIRVRSYPISVDPVGLLRFARTEAVEERVTRIRERMTRAGASVLIVRADRIEPSKNALRGFLAFEALLDRRPELRRRVRFLAIQASTRTEIAEYARYGAAVREVVARINGLAEPDEQPIWISDGSDYAMAIAALRLADVVVVNPLVDGMNLVAKEAVLVGERDPVLILSETAGAAEQLAADSLLVAPADVAGTAEMLDQALRMPADERRARLRRLRASVREEDLAWWLRRQLRDVAALRRGQIPPSRRLRDTVRRVESGVAG
jgi:trehalose 6-phosphate synthase